MSLIDSVKSWFYKRQNGWFTLMVVAAFASIISFFQINSYGADKNGLNGVWTISGIVWALAAIFFLYKAGTTSTGKSG